MTIPIKVIPKDPQATLDYGIDWANGGANDGLATDYGWLQGDTIESSVWTVPAGITQVSSSFSDTVTRVWLSGGTAGTAYEIVNTITTANSPHRVDERTIRIEVQER